MKTIPIRQLISPRSDTPSSVRFKIRRVEDILDSANLFHELHRHDFFFIIALQKGGGSHEIDFTIYNVLGHSIFCMRPGQVHQLQLNAGSTGFVMEFNAEFYHPANKLAAQRLRKASNKNYCKLEIKRFEKLYAILTNIFEEYTAREEGFQDVIKANLDIFFIEFVRQSTNPNSPSININPYAQSRLEEFLELVETHIATHKKISRYTDLMNLSAYQLNEITKETLGKTASELINEYIVLEAKRNLLATPNQIKDIADQLGYEDVSYFIRFFKKHSGYSPEAFRHHFK